MTTWTTWTPWKRVIAWWCGASAAFSIIAAVGYIFGGHWLSASLEATAAAIDLAILHWIFSMQRSRVSSDD